MKMYGKSLSVLLFVLFIPLFILACGPVYQTDYSFIPPTTEHGQMCVFQCDNSKIQCEQLEEMRYQNCLDRADRDYHSCEMTKRYGYNKNGEWVCQENCYCFRSSCSLDESKCHERYRACYQTCGGKVESRTYCVSNCEKIQQRDDSIKY